MKKSGLSTSVSVFALASLSLLATDFQTAHAQGLALEEIVVTARKRDESLLEVPVSITAFTSADIEQRGIYDVRDVSIRTPSFQYAQQAGLAGGGRFNPNITFRGMQNLTPVPQDQTASAFIDGVFLTGGPQAVNTIDIERIEVLKGPQSAYFGKATFGGAVNFITKTPGNEFATQVNAELATYQSHKVAFANEGPLIEDKLFYRVSLSSDQKGAMYQSSTDGGDLGEESTLQGVLTLYATPSDRTSFKLRLSAQEIDDSSPASSYLKGSVYAPTACDGFTFPALDVQGNPIQAAVDSNRIDYFCGSPIPSLGELGEGVMSMNTSFNSPFYAANPNFSEIPLLAERGFTLREVFVDNIQGDEFIARSPKLDHFGIIRRDYRVILQADHEFENGMSIEGNAAYSLAEGNKLYDWDNTGVDSGYVMAPTEYEDYFFEARFLSNQEDRLRWLLGANYYDGTVGFDFIGTTQLRVKFADAVNRATRYTNADSFGVFGSIEYDVTDQFGVIVEGRYQTDKETIVPTGQSTQTFKEWAPRFILTYDPTDDIHLYGSYSVGILPGRNNVAFRTASQFVRDQLIDIFGDLQEVAPSDKLKNWEAGIKQQAFDGRLQYALTGYYAKWKNKKITAGVPVQLDPNDPTSLNFIGNVVVPGEIKLWGGEFEGDAQVTDSWVIGGTVGYNKSENVVVFNQGESFFGTANFKGNKEPRNPTWTWTARTTYTAPFHGEWSWYTRGEALFKGKFFTDNANIGQARSRLTVNWRVGLDRGDWLFEAFVTNLFQNKDWVEAQRLTDLAIAFDEAQFPTNMGVLVQAPDKRQIGVRTRLSF